jgi:Uma2 family endonuclease/transposase-like protein
MTLVAPSIDSDALIAPDEATWHAMSPEQRVRFIERVHDALEEQRDLMTEGRPHSRAKSRAMDMLGRYFRRIGRRVYLASELPVLYPGEHIVHPDLMAVLDVDDAGDEDERTAWVVADEGKGPEFALEVHYLGDENKDFVRNVTNYARLGIQEYIIYDRRRQSLVGYRLQIPKARTYERVHVRFGRLSSVVLGLDLQVRGGKLRFYRGDAELPDSDELIARIEGMVDDLTLRRDEAEVRAQQEQARAEQEQARAEQEQARAEQEQARAEQEQARAERILSDLRSAVLDVLTARGLTPGDELRQRIAECEDSATLRGWTARAVTAATADDVLR